MNDTINNLEALDALDAQEVQEGPDAARWDYPTVVFRDAAGNPLETWQVRLMDYVEGHRGEVNDWVIVHRIAVARALLHGQPVPELVQADHDPELLAKELADERRLHGEMPNPYCPHCEVQVEDADEQPE